MQSRRWTSRLGAGFFCLSLTLGFSGAVTALPTDDGVLEVFIAGSEDEVHRLGNVMDRALRRPRVSVRTQRAAAIDPHKVARAGVNKGSVARLWLDCHESGRVRLYLTNGDGTRVFTREIALERGLDPVALRLLALVASNSVEALLAGGEIGIPRDEYEKDLPASVADAGAPAGNENPTAPGQVTEKPNPPGQVTDKLDPPKPPMGEPKEQAPSSVHAAEAPVALGGAISSESPGGRGATGPSKWRWHLDAFYEAEALGSGVLQHGPGARLEWGLGNVSVGVEGIWRIPWEVGDGPLHARLSSRAVRAFVARPFRLTDSMSMAWGLSLGVDWIQVEPIAAESDAQTAGPFSVGEAVARTFLAWRYRWRGVELGALAGAEYGVVAADYQIARGNRTESLFSPWRVRPLGAAMIGTRF